MTCSKTWTSETSETSVTVNNDEVQGETMCKTRNRWMFTPAGMQD